MKRFLCICSALILLFGLIPASAAESAAWICPKCGQSGNTGNFCPNCAAPKPDTGWTCGNCGQAGNTGNFCTNCASPKPGSSSVNSQLEQIPGEAYCVKVRVQSVDASSFIANKSNPNLWSPANAADGDESTCWQFSSKKSGTLGKTWLSLRLSSPQTVNALWIKNGFWAYGTSGKDQYVINARPKGIRVECYNNGSMIASQEFSLKDDKARSGWQKLELNRQSAVTEIRLWILSAYKGSQYPNDVCLSEVMLVQYASASIAQPAQAAKAPTVYESPRSTKAANLLMRLSTRSGPGTEYDEPGTFFSDTWKNQTVQVLGKYWDGGIWWVLIDFASGGSRYRVWTGLKRVDVNIDLLPEIYPKGQGTVNATDTRRGPGSNYAKGPRITSWKDVEAFGRENGYVEIEYHDYSKDRVYRCWVPESTASIDW